MKQLRAIAGIILSVLVVVLFIWYAKTHPTLLNDLKKVGLPTILMLLLLYSVSLITIALILAYSVSWCGHAIRTKENILLTVYSTLVNFFGPLQSGPGFRAIYLKAKHKVNLKSFIVISLFYYLMLCWYSAIALFLGDHRWWPVMFIVIAGLLVLGLAVLLSLRLRWLYKLLSKSPVNLIKIAVMTLLQTMILVIIYYVELKAMNRSTTFGQALSYTGAANFSLFFALTPGAIGVREAFVLFTRQISHLSSSTIIAASVLDRAVYFIYLGVLFVFALSVHLKDRFKIKPTD